MNLTKQYASFYNAPNQFSENKARGGNSQLCPGIRVWKAKKEPPSRQLFFGINPVFMRVCGPYFSASSTATAQATVAPTMGLLPMPIKPIISTCAGTEEEPANCASECIRPMVSVIP